MWPMAGSIALRRADHRAQSACDAPPQARVIDLHAVDGDTLVPTIDDGDFRCEVAQDRRPAPALPQACDRRTGCPASSAYQLPVLP